MTNKKLRPAVIIRRDGPSGPPQHQGGAWKVAYADFVTAMMAFFLLMWLLNATTEKQKTGLADYFAPTIIHVRQDGSTTLSRKLAEQSRLPATAMEVMGENRNFEALAEEISNELAASDQSSPEIQALLRHISTRISDEGLVIQLGDLTDSPLFLGETSAPTPALRELTQIISRAIGSSDHEIAFTGHVSAYSTVRADSPAWSLSYGRAQAVRNLVEAAGTDSRRTRRVTAAGDRNNLHQNPMEPKNNRIELIILR